MNWSRGRTSYPLAICMALVSGAVVAGIASCSSSGEEGAAGAAPSGAGGSIILPEGGFNADAADPDAFWADDPPPPQCLDSGLSVVVPGGTPECPDDKNREGCTCPELGAKAPCWPGFRRNRNRGVCHDGETECVQSGELGRVWGECKGYQLPTGTVGAEACVCFSLGQWKIANLSPCFLSFGSGELGDNGASSTIWKEDLGKGDCPDQIQEGMPVPAEPWSPNTLKVDCSGHFRLCLTLKAGSFEDPKGTDCVLAHVCTEGDYPEANVVQAMPPLPGWLATSPDEVTCAQRFVAEGGYAEMSAVGLTVECDEIGDFSGGQEVMFNRVKYCPLWCNEPDRKDDPLCVNCMSGSGGTFD